MIIGRQQASAYFPPGQANRVLPVREVQVRSRVAPGKLAADRPVIGPCAALRRDARVVLFLA